MMRERCVVYMAVGSEIMLDVEQMMMMIRENQPMTIGVYYNVAADRASW